MLAVIVANGSSVDQMGAEFWRRCERDDVLLVGTNRALCFKTLQGVRLDAMVIRDTYRDLWRDQKFGEIYHRDFWRPASCWKVGPADRRVTHCDQFVRQAPGWQGGPVADRNGELAVMKNSSVAIMAANWAWLQGARTICLVGVDYCGGHGAMLDPFAAASPGWEGQYDKPVSAAIERQFARSAEAIQSSGGVIVNFSSSSRLAAINPADWRTTLGT
ncbi:MAG: hypothetical protein HN350_14785 [Phycisphaerales bacterium]|nr:hypothetical protein [Phycisphaerales bacterium]